MLTDITLMLKPNEELYKKILGKIVKTELLECFQCSRCTGGCTAFKLLELVPHEVIKLVKLGFVENLVNSDIIWTCASCLQCTERCPQRASPYHVIVALRNTAVETQTKVPEAYLKAVSQILETGLMQPIEKITTKKMETLDRDKLNLPKIRFPSEEFKANFLKTLGEL